MIERPQRAMAIFAHPDDEIACAGTIAAWVQQGTQVAYVVCTNGDKGTEDMEMRPEALATTREQEQRGAAAVLGVQELVFLRHGDGELEDTREFRGELVREIRRFRPQVVLTPAPFSRSRHSHRDHRVCGAVTLDAVFPYARDPWHYSELTRAGFLPHKVGLVLLWGSDSPDEFVDIGETMELKTRAMLQHRSQFVDRPRREPNREPGEFMRQAAKRAGEQAGLPLAEAFQKMEFRL